MSHRLHVPADVETPVGVIDLDRVRANAKRVVAYCRRHGLTWRPHIKTHKSLEVAKIQLAAGAQGLTVATPREAEVMAEATDDLLLAYPPVGHAKLARILALPERVKLTVGLDSHPVLDELSSAAAASGREEVGVLIEIDVGMGRVGVTTPGECVELAQKARSLPGVRYAGIMFYPGHIRVHAEQQDGPLEALGARLAQFYEPLGDAGLAPGVVSGGSTPTLWHSHRMAGVTEVRAGTCIFNDRDIARLGACGPEDLAYSVLATVVSDAVPGQVVVDSGSKALAKEAFRAGGEGYGVLLDRPEVTVRALSEEHGILDLSATDWRLRVGDQVRVVPNHVCVSVNLQDHLLGLEQGALRVVELPGRGRGHFGSVVPA